MGEPRKTLFRRMWGGVVGESAEAEGRTAEEAHARAAEERLSGTGPSDLPPPIPDPDAPPVSAVAAGPKQADPEEPVADPSAPMPPTPDTAGPGGDSLLAAQPTGWFQRLRRGLSRSSGALTGQIASIFTKRRLDAAILQEFEDALIQADLGLDTAAAITEAVGRGRYGRELSGEEVRGILAAEVERALQPVARPLVIDPARRPHVILVVGVNGTGKTTTIGKLAAKYRAEGYSVMLAAGDTFRAAAIDQLKIWGERTGARVVARDVGADAAGLAYDALHEAKAAGTELLIIDTAGRLQNRTELMAELEKVIRVIRKQDPSAPHTVLLTLDATTGQNALSQVEIFGQKAGVTGLVMTKLDGTARGGILVAIAARHKLPVHFIGVGEGVEDLEPFSPRDFARAIAGL